MPSESIFVSKINILCLFFFKMCTAVKVSASANLPKQSVRLRFQSRYPKGHVLI